MRFLVLLACIVIVTGCAKNTVPVPDLQLSTIEPYVDLEARRLQLKSMSEKERSQYCHRKKEIESIDIRLDTHVKVSGYPDFAIVNTQNYFTGNLFKMISLYVSGELELGEISDKLTEAAQLRAFEKLRPYALPDGRSMNAFNEPIYHQAHILVPLGTIFPELERVFGRKNPQIVKIRAWGDRLYDSVNSGMDNPGQTGPDLPAVKAMASAVWGTATGDSSKILTAFRDYNKALETIVPGGEDRIWKGLLHKGRALSSKPGVRRETRHRDLMNTTYGYLVITAEALVRGGIPDAYEMPEKGRSLHDAVRWLLENTAKEDLHRRYWGDGARTVSWYEIYAARFPENAKQLEQNTFIGSMLEWEPRFFGAMMGGATTCLFRPIETAL